jgi:hypothetical protein
MQADLGVVFFVILLMTAWNTFSVVAILSASSEDNWTKIGHKKVTHGYMRPLDRLQRPQ